MCSNTNLKSKMKYFLIILNFNSETNFNDNEIEL